MELLADVLRRSGAQAVEDVVVPLFRALCADPGLLQKVVGHESTDDRVLVGNRQHTCSEICPPRGQKSNAA